MSELDVGMSDTILIHILEDLKLYNISMKDARITHLVEKSGYECSSDGRWIDCRLNVVIHMYSDDRDCTFCTNFVCFRGFDIWIPCVYTTYRWIPGHVDAVNSEFVKGRVFKITDASYDKWYDNSDLYQWTPVSENKRRKL